VTTADPGRHLLDRIDAREQALAREASDVQARIDGLTARLREVSEAISDLQVTRKTLLSLASQDDTQPAGVPAEPAPALPEHPACQQILTAFTDLGRPLRARDLCVALDLPIASKNTENIRSKLKRLVSRGILIETEPGLFAQPRPWRCIRQRSPGAAAGSRAQQAPEHCQVRGISQFELRYLSRREPADGVVLVRLHVRHLAPPAARGPHGEVQAALRVDAAQDRAAVNAPELRSQLFGHFPPERIQGILARLDMPTGEIPHVRIRQPRRRPVTKQHFLRPQQDHGHDVMLHHPPSITPARAKAAGCGPSPAQEPLTRTPSPTLTAKGTASRETSSHTRSPERMRFAEGLVGGEAAV
jgi:hypothetical protein